MSSSSSSSKMTITSLHALVIAQQAQIDALTARLDARDAAPAAAAEAAEATEAPAKGKRGAKKEKKPRDPDAPKRAPTTFFLFSAAERAKSLAAGGPKLDVKVCAARWALLNDEQKAAFKTATPVASDAE
jgi:hypothetical protein